MWKISFLFLIIVFSIAKSEDAANKIANAETLFNMSFEEMLNVEVVSSSFIGIDKIKEPASVTIITAEDIELTPHRSLYDLLEVYVPGAIWMTHYDSPHIGIRGIINQRNDKILLLVNGKNMNFKAHNGATSELENWDLNDIEKIEIIRGPGSVIYGPGAVEAVINITTKDFNSGNTHLNIGGYFPYNNKSARGSYNYNFNDNIKLFAYGSIVSTGGYYPEKGFYIGGNSSINDIETIKSKPPFQDILVDSEDKPQIKAHLQLDIGENTSLWARYTRSGSTVNGIVYKGRYQTGFDPDTFYTTTGYKNFNQAKNEQFVISLSNNIIFGDDYKLSTFLSFDSENNSRNQDYIQLHPKAWAAPDNIMKMLADPQSLRNRYFACAETETQLRMLLTKDFSNDLSLAIGYEYSYNFWGESWFHNDGYFRLGDNWNILTDKNSPAYGYKIYFGTDSNDTYFVGDGWGTHTISIFGEAIYKIQKSTTMILSGRIDKDSYSHLMFSPRLAFIYGIDDLNYLKFIAQKSVRMNTAEELYIQHIKNKTPEDEKLYNAELIYTSLLRNDFLINLSAFYSMVDVLTWKDDLRSTLNSGRLQLYGIELEAKFHNNFMNIILNHSYIKQISWELSPNVYQAGMSYSDYYTPINGATFVGIGNDLNNWSNNVTKLIANFNIFDDILIAHFDSRIYWGFQGAKDGIQMMKNALGTATDSVKLKQIIDLVEKYNTYDTDIRMNAALKLNILKNLGLTCYAQNLINLTNNKRLRYDTGSKEQKWDYYLKNALIIEPFTIGLSLDYKF